MLRCCFGAIEKSRPPSSSKDVTSAISSTDLWMSRVETKLLDAELN